MVRRALIISGSMWLLMVAGILLSFQSLPPIVPLFYSLVRGEQQLAAKSWLFLLPVLALVFGIVHVWLGKYFFGVDRLLSRMAMMSLVLMVFLFLVALGHILIIVL